MLLTFKKHNSQKYSLVAPKGRTKERDHLLRKLVWKHSHFVPGAQFSPKYKSRQWNGRVNVFTPTNIHAGFLKETIDFLEAEDIEYSLDGFQKEETSTDYTYEEFFNFCKKLIEACDENFEKKYKLHLEIRDYQIQAAWRFLTNPYDTKTGIALHATSAGKSLTIAFILGFLFYKEIIKKAIIIVPRLSLVTQFAEDLIDFGFKESSVGKLYGKTKQINCPITVAIINSIYNLQNTLDGDDFYQNTDLVICDEVHKASSKTLSSTITSFSNAKYFFGCTGTLPEEELDRKKIFSLFGDVLDKRKLKELEEDYQAVSSVKIGIIKFCYGKQALMNRIKQRVSSTGGWRDEVDFLQNDDTFRNPYIISTAYNNFKSKRNIVLLVKNIDYGVKLYNMVKKKMDENSDDTSYLFNIFASGDEKKDLEERDKIIKFCKNSDHPYIIVTNFQIFSVGLNIPNLSCVIFCDSMKSKITIAQSIGRGVRKAQNKENVLILDITSDMKYDHRHYRKRKKLYQEEGFQVMEKTIKKPN